MPPALPAWSEWVVFQRGDSGFEFVDAAAEQVEVVVGTVLTTAPRTWCPPTRSRAGRCCATVWSCSTTPANCSPTAAPSPPPRLIDPAQPDHPVAQLHAAHRRGEGMTDSPTRACPPASDHRRWSARQPTKRPDSQNRIYGQHLLRTEQHPPARPASPGPTAAPRSAFGRSWTLTPHRRLPIHRRRKQNQGQQTDQPP